MKTLFSKLLQGLLVILFVCFGSSATYAQGQRMESMRIAFLTQDLGLSADQAEKFWPVFNEFAAKRKALQVNLRSAQNRLTSPTASDADLYASVEEVLMLRQKELDLTKEYVPRLRKVLTAKQLGRLVTVEKRMAKTFLNRRGMAGGQGALAAPAPSEED